MHRRSPIPDAVNRSFAFPGQRPRWQSAWCTLCAQLLAVLALAALFSPAWGRTVLDLDIRQQPVLLQDWGDYW